MLKVIVTGYGEMFASLISGVKFSGHEVVGAFRYDRVRFSKSALFFKDLFNPSLELSFLKSHKIKDIKANSANSKEFIKAIKQLKADVVIVGSWGEKIKPEVFNIPKYGFINCHPALLPKHRGANPYFWAIKNGDDKTGVTFHKIEEKLDKGDILYQGAIKIEENMNALDLKHKACKVAEIMIKELLDDMEKGVVIPIKQNEDEASFEYQISPDDLILNLDDTKKNIKNHIKALAPYFNPLYKKNNKIYEIKSCNFLDENEFSSNFKSGDIIKEENNKTFIKCKDCVIEIRNY